MSFLQFCFSKVLHLHGNILKTMPVSMETFCSVSMETESWSSQFRKHLRKLCLYRLQAQLSYSRTPRKPWMFSVFMYKPDLKQWFLTCRLSAKKPHHGSRTWTRVKEAPAFIERIGTHWEKRSNLQLIQRQQACWFGLEAGGIPHKLRENMQTVRWAQLSCVIVFLLL